MNDQDKKIAKIKNNCRIGKVIATIMCIICICGCVLSAIGGIAMYANSEEWEPKIAQAIEEGKIDTDKVSIGTAKMFHIEGIDPDTGDYVGRSYMDSPDIDGIVYVRGVTVPGNIVPVKITEEENGNLFGSVL